MTPRKVHGLSKIRKFASKWRKPESLVIQYNVATSIFRYEQILAKRRKSLFFILNLGNF